MAEFDRVALVVDLQTPPQKILMVVRAEDEGRFVMFADPQRLRPYVDVLLREDPDHYNETKRGYAIEGFAEAARGAESCNIPGPGENPLPMASVSLRRHDSATLAFTDGLARTALLIERGASFVPLEAPNEREANAMHRLLGGRRRPEPASLYIVSEATRRELIASYRPD